jgi:hypothetical protein
MSAVSLLAVADEILLVIASHLNKPWWLAVNRSLRAFLLAQDGTRNNAKLTACVKVNKELYLSSQAHGKDDHLLACLQEHCRRYEVLGLCVGGLRRDFERANFGRVLSLAPSLTTLDLQDTVLPRDSFAGTLAEMTGLTRLRLKGSTAFLRQDDLVLPTALTELCLGHCHVTQFEVGVLIKAVKRPNLVLKVFDLSMNSLWGIPNVPDLIRALPALQEMDLSMTALKGDDLVRVLSALAKCTGLNVLRLGGLPVIDPRKTVSKAHVGRRLASDQRIFSKLFACTALEELSLNGMFVGLPHARKLAEALGAMPQLQRLDLSNTDMGWEGATEVAASLAVLPLLKRVTMHNVDIASTGARAIRDAVAGRTQLVKLELTGSNFQMEYLNF